METTMKVKLIAHTRLSDEFREYTEDPYNRHSYDWKATEGQAIALTAIRTCYSPNKPSEIVIKEGYKYFGNKATDGGEGTEADRLFRHITSSGHTSTLEHLSFTFAIEGVSRSLLAQLTRHRVGFSFSVQSQRYVRLGSNDRSGGFDYVIPDTINDNVKAMEFFDEFTEITQALYDNLREINIPAEDARSILPNATATNLVMTSNLTALIHFYAKRRKGNGAQSEIAELAEQLRKRIIEVEPWTNDYFEAAGAKK